MQGAKRFRAHVEDSKDGEGKRIYNYEEIESLYGIIDMCTQLGAIPIMITSPYLAEYNASKNSVDNTYEGDFGKIINQITEETEVKYYDYSKNMRLQHKYEWFMDVDHLNYYGATAFTNIVFDEVIYPELINARENSPQGGD